MRKIFSIILGTLLTSLAATAQEPSTAEAIATNEPTATLSVNTAVETASDSTQIALQYATSLPKRRSQRHFIHSSAQEAMDKYNRQTSPRKSYQGYRIRIFASHTQSARTDAEAAMELFREHYNVPLYFSYENPYFLVTCGNCLTQEEAIMLLSKVRIHFPKAFIVTTEIPAELFTTPPTPAPEQVVEDGAEQSEDGEGTDETDTTKPLEVIEMNIKQEEAPNGTVNESEQTI